MSNDYKNKELWLLRIINQTILRQGFSLERDSPPLDEAYSEFGNYTCTYTSVKTNTRRSSTNNGQIEQRTFELKAVRIQKGVLVFHTKALAASARDQANTLQLKTTDAEVYIKQRVTSSLLYGVASDRQTPGFKQIPEELLITLFMFLDTKSICRTFCCGRAQNQISRSDYFWDKLGQRDIRLIQHPISKEKYKDWFVVKQNRTIQRRRTLPLVDVGSDDSDTDTLPPHPRTPGNIQWFW
eukprot:CAMPEP_0204881456 /NCGR_PEP_ID=MMETSP1349-20130617/2706_1 /ASSEMBLY_ACC=CAM_ASM_000710 /TAXON_ID=215587 /ORGANISM="Aplanochytrium stocchinoi, Strain GSBS06" /LENGTH=239 /DNA_ID=CAMNT_0052040397 /DNA_START=30 /DNA_END=746 /DNA_ORIENTATION=+